jgi:hypothetical protein
MLWCSTKRIPQMNKKEIIKHLVIYFIMTIFVALAAIQIIDASILMGYKNNEVIIPYLMMK